MVRQKLLFMGAEFGQWNERNHDSSLDWHLLQYPLHQGLGRWLADVNHLYRAEPALRELDSDPTGFEWIDCNDSEQSTLSMIRKGKTSDHLVVIIFNLTPVPRQNHRLGVPGGGSWKEILNSDATVYGGRGWGNLGSVEAVPLGVHGRPFSLSLTLPPLSALFLGTGNPASNSG
jgi:1,4-alpha-glucan branching enzyme